MIELYSQEPIKVLKVSKALCDYNFLMTHMNPQDTDFQKVYYSFYLKSRWKVFGEKNNRKIYFDLMERYKNTENISIKDITKYLYEEMTCHTYEFSMASKLIHTLDRNRPIYDSCVKRYLEKYRKVEFKWNPCGKKKKPKFILSDIEEDYKAIEEWYKNFLATNESQEWLRRFDDLFPGYGDNISKIKKIDFIIWGFS